MSGSPDACAALDKKSEEHKAKLQMFGFPTECPIPEGRRCMTGDKKIDVNKYKSMLPMALGKLQIMADIEHDTVSDAPAKIRALKFNFCLFNRENRA